MLGQGLKGDVAPSANYHRRLSSLLMQGEIGQHAEVSMLGEDCTVCVKPFTYRAHP